MQETLRLSKHHPPRETPPSFDDQYYIQPSKAPPTADSHLRLPHSTISLVHKKYLNAPSAPSPTFTRIKQSPRQTESHGQDTHRPAQFPLPMFFMPEPPRRGRGVVLHKCPQKHITFSSATFPRYSLCARGFLLHPAGGALRAMYKVRMRRARAVGRRAHRMVDAMRDIVSLERAEDNFSQVF